MVRRLPEDLSAEPAAQEHGRRNYAEIATSLGRMSNDCADACSPTDERARVIVRKKDETIREIGNGLRRESEDITHEPLPRRWVELIQHLNEKERQQSEARDQPEAEPRRHRE